MQLQQQIPIEKFYRDLQTAYTDCGSQDVKLLLMNGNVETGNRMDLFPNLLGPHAVPEVGPPTETTPNGERFIDFCITNNLILGYSWFQKAIRRNPYICSTFFPNNPRHMPKTIDHILIDGRSISNLLNIHVRHDVKISTMSTPRIEGMMGHRLVVATLRQKLARHKPKPQQKACPTIEQL